MTAGFSLRKIKKSVTLGSRLKRARKRLKLEIVEIEIQTKIRSKYLIALENDDYKKLPADAYTKGFVVRYAKFLGLNEKKSLDDFLRQKSHYHLEAENIISPNKSFREVKYIITPKIFAPVLIILTVLGMFSYLFIQIYGFAAAPDLLISKPANNSVIESESIEITGNTSQQADVYVNEQKIQVAGDGSFSVDYRMLPGINIISIKSINKAEKQKIVTYTLEYKPQSAKAPATILNNGI